MLFKRIPKQTGRTVLAVLAVALVPPALGAPGAMAREVVQALPDPASARLNDALHRLSRNPESLPALLQAGRASLDLGDLDAAEGFLLRAQAIAPEDGRTLTGLALISLRRALPVESLELFERAGEAGEDLRPYAAERGLAYDLVGNNAQAKRLYGLALAENENAETLRRLALSYAISGDLEASEATLLPLLQRRDLAAYRARAFALAIHGREAEALSIAETLLPARLSQRLGPYLRYMPRLTRAQQAAAANLGSFPPADQVGRDDPRFAGLASTPVIAPPVRTADSRLIPGGEPLGDARRAETAQGAPEPPSGIITEQVRREPLAVASIDEDDALAPPQRGIAGPSFSISEPADAGRRAESEIDLVEAFADFELDEADTTASPNGDAVDITAIQPAREAPAQPPPPAHPSRHWVQLATGQDASAFRFDWRRIARNAGGLLDGREAHRARWNQTNRLLTGPFDSADAAQDFVTALGRQGVDSFRFTSARGEEVVPLD